VGAANVTIGEPSGWLKLFVDAQMEQATAAGHGYAEGAADYRERADIARDPGGFPSDWAWPMEGADEAYLEAVGVGTIASRAGIASERWDVVSDTWLLAFRAGYTEAHEATATFEETCQACDDAKASGTVSPCDEAK
jgi:hypothetical protein